MIKSKALTILLALFIFTATTPLSVCASHDSDTPSIYNSTEGNFDALSMGNLTDNDSALSIYNSTGINSVNSADDSIDGSSVDSSYTWTLDETAGPLKRIEFKEVPIDDAYSRDKLGDINVSDGTLEAATRFGLWLEEQGIDAEAENISILFIDDDLRVIENYWIFAASPEAKERDIEIIKNSKSVNPSSDEMVAFLKQFDEKYPVKYVRAGLTLFVTVENKDVLLSEISEEDIQMLEAIKTVLFEEPSMDLKWGSSNPNVHLDMSGTAAKKVGFNGYFINMIANNAAVPDYIAYLEIIDGIRAVFSASPLYSISGVLINAIEYFYIKNYNHYYNPTALFGIGFGGAVGSIEDLYDKVSTNGPKEEKAANLSYASHYMADLSMPLHTNHALNQTTTVLESLNLSGIEFEQPHFAYEDYVGANWATGYNFYQYAKDDNSYYPIQDLNAHSKYLANYSYYYSDVVWEYGRALMNNSSSIPSSQIVQATQYCIIEGQRSVNGLMVNGYQQMKTEFINQQSTTLQLGTFLNPVPQVDLTRLRVSMGSGDSANISLNGRQILRFVDSSAGGNLYIYNENGNQLGVISQVNGKPAFENVTFDVAFIQKGSKMLISIDKFDSGALNGSYSYFYTTNSNMSTLTANMAGYASNIDYISSEYNIYRENTMSEDYTDGFFEKTQDTTTLQLEKSGYRIRQIVLEDLRVSMGSGDSANISINGRQILKFVDSSSGGNLYVYNENGNQLGVIYNVNGKPAFENSTFDFYTYHDGSKMNIAIAVYDNGIFGGTFQYSYMTNNDISTLRANMAGYQPDVDYISGRYWVLYEA